MGEQICTGKSRYRLKRAIPSSDEKHGPLMALAMRLFEMGRLTGGQAAQLAGVSRVVLN
jgi:hypothetical protein